MTKINKNGKVKAKNWKKAKKGQKFEEKRRKRPKMWINRTKTGKQSQEIGKKLQ